MSFSATLWAWYGQDEHKRVLAVCEAILALEFLALTADKQQTTIPDCPACEAWSGMVLPLNEALAICSSHLPVNVKTGLQNIWELCINLSEAAFHCNDRTIFDHSEWSLIRTAAGELLGLMEAPEIHPFMDELLLDCRNAACGIRR